MSDDILTAKEREARDGAERTASNPETEDSVADRLAGLVAIIDSLVARVREVERERGEAREALQRLADIAKGVKPCTT